MDYTVTKSSLKGSLRIPSSKSQTLRAILFGALGKSKTHIHHYLPSPDTNAMMQACRLLGASIDATPQTLLIEGVNGKIKQVDDVIHAGNSGILLRFITAIAAQSAHYTVLTGDHSIRHQRPMQPLLEALVQLGAWATSTKGDGFAPLVIKGPLHPGEAHLTGEDSQPISSLLIATAFSKGPTTLNVRHPGEKPWIGLTLNWFDRLGIPYENHQFSRYQLKGHAQYAGFDYRVPGDLSSAAFPIAAALLTQSELTLHNIDLTDAQGDKQLISIFIQMGAQIDYDNNQKTLFVKKGAHLKGITVDINDFIDSLPILAVVGCFAEGITHIKNAKVARQKECDRLCCMTMELRKMGAQIIEEEDALIVHHTPLHAAAVSSHRDHRIAMALTVAALALKGESLISNVECVAKTYPNFLEHFLSVGANIRKKE